MSTEKQIAANKVNAQRSTGPRTTAGKSKVSLNALKHGLTSRHLALPGEDPDALDSFRAGLLSSLAPVGALECALSELIAATVWRLHRVPIHEATLHRRSCKELVVSEARNSVSECQPSAEMSRIWLEEKMMTDGDRRALEQAKQRLVVARAQLDEPSLQVALTLKMSPEPFLNLGRHETALTRSLWRMMHELERSQAKRAGDHVPVPAVVDVDVSVRELAGADSGAPGSGEPDKNHK